MIIEQAEINELSRHFEQQLIIENAANHDPDANDEYPATQYLYQNPHLLLAAGYDEYQLINENDKNAESLLKKFYRVNGSLFPLGHEAILRDRKSGKWRLFQGLQLPFDLGSPLFDKKKEKDTSLRLIFDEGWEISEYSAANLIADLKVISKNPIESTSVLAFSRLWAPSQARKDEPQIIEATRSIIKNINCGHETLQDVGWRDLEEIVAEVLRAQGMKISVTQRSHDGGRDIIARGELFGEPLTLAVEVKQKSVVPVSDVRAALYANRHLPALMLVTSGVFSAGVVKEKQREENSLRLILKDGVALHQWLRSYQPLI